MKFHDISKKIYPGMAVYKNIPEKQPVFTKVTNKYITETRVYMDVHSGTHLDAPLHMIEGGETIETISLDRLVRPCKVIELMNVENKIEAHHLHSLNIQKDDFILFKTKNSFDEAFNPNFIFVGEDAAHYLESKEIAGVGIDALGIERSQEGHPTHKTLLQKDILILEGIDLSTITPGDYFMIVLPLPLVGTDAAPARVILMEGMA